MVLNFGHPLRSPKVLVVRSFAPICKSSPRVHQPGRIDENAPANPRHSRTTQPAMEATSEGNSQRLMGAMEMEMGTLLQDGTEEKWEAISDLDAFFSRVYDYFNERGLRCIITARIINLLTLLFTITRASPVESGPPEASASMPAPEAPRRFRLPQARAKLGQPAARSALAQ